MLSSSARASGADDGDATVSTRAPRATRRDRIAIVAIRDRDANERTNANRPSAPRDLEFPHLIRWRARVVPAIVRSAFVARARAPRRARCGAELWLGWIRRARRDRVDVRGSVAATSVARAGECRRASRGALTRTRGKSAGGVPRVATRPRGGSRAIDSIREDFTRQVFFRGGER